MKITILFNILSVSLMYNDIFSKCTCSNNKKNSSDDLVVNKEKNVRFRDIKKGGKEYYKYDINNIVETIINSRIKFVNKSNFCYFNSAIQLLIHDKRFIDTFFDLYLSKGYSTDIDVSEDFKDLLLFIYNNIEKNKIICYDSFINTISKANRNIRNFNVNNANDSFYFLLIFLNNITKELVGNNFKEGAYVKYGNVTFKELFLYNILSFNIEKNKKTVKDYLNQLDNNLKDYISKNKKNIIIKFRRVKKKKKKREKLHNDIYINDKIKIDDAEYQLKSIVVHIGKTSEEGHYINFTKLNDGWYCFNDHRCNLCNVDNINNFKYKKSANNTISKNCYYLLYYRL